MAEKRTGNRIYTQEFKPEAVTLTRKGEKPISQVARDTGISARRLYRWLAARWEAA
jgi:transposase-like protein